MVVSSRETWLERGIDHWVGRFAAMASPCELLIETDREQEALDVLDTVSRCAWRIEDKYSRYRNDNVVHAINHSAGQPLAVDAETADLLDFASTLHQLSDGLFDITSGVLRRAWRFDGGQQLPDANTIHELLTLVGWDKIRWQRPILQMQPGMQIDFGGFGKEYAVDQAAGATLELIKGSCLVNFGGDLAVARPRLDGSPWQVGIEAAGSHSQAAMTVIELKSGALATSGDTHRFVLQNGQRLTHILDPRTGWPVENAPRSVTVAADSCMQAGMLTTLAVLRGQQAEAFLRNEGVRYWIQYPG